MITQDPAIDNLENKINTLRVRMVHIGQTKGLTHPETIKYSQELDQHLNEYHQRRYR